MGLARVWRKSEASEANVQSGDCRFSAEGACRLVTYGLGSDVVVIAHAPQVGISAVWRFAYSNSQIDLAKAKDNAWLFADTGVGLLLSTMRKCGATNPEIEVQAIGAANLSQEENGVTSRGRSNELALRKSLWAHGVLLRNEDLGGAALRTVWFDPASNRLLVRSDTRRATGRLELTDRQRRAS